MFAVFEGVPKERATERLTGRGNGWQVVTVTGTAYFDPAPADNGGCTCILNTESRRHWIAAKAFGENVERALKNVGYTDLFADDARADVTVWLSVWDNGDVLAKSVEISANHGGGHSDYALNPCGETESLFNELTEELNNEARRLRRA